ncbi:FAD-binding oxidoreductase [Spirulina major CS-329]|uniref:FAD-binding oxidoreductase n=1 Tax=Spirulina TaxID=1154 RepID=UPI00232B1736|nr:MULTISPECIES: FAD-binding oxidoreductase [Spirulina]MDB9494022.1 FAD-binding oxidoreductase [Spirulina subsalsa CS-330]MDB9502234.1 FAD-binding oxidoreductase [Spirulina major CS-329]
MSNTVQQTLTGWGRYPVVKSTVQRPENLSTLSHSLSSSASQLARGLGRSYGDAPLNHSGQTVLMERLNRMVAFDAETGRLRCEAGVPLHEILAVFVPRGWFLSVTPGTKFVTVGGAIAFDVHGKNHHCAGSFARHVECFELLIASGEILTCSRTENADLFWATVGGMGLTGIILEAEFKLKKIASAYIKSFNIKAKNLDEAIALFAQYEPLYPYSVAWIDCLATGRSLGRSILMFGDTASLSDLSPQQQVNPLPIHEQSKLSIPLDAPSVLLNRYTMGSFNQLYYHRQMQKEQRAIAHYDPFFYPLDFVNDWNRLYGKRGFVQYQCVLPMATSHDGLTEILQRSSQKGWASFLAVLKRMGNQEAELLSFPMPGYTLALDIPIKPGLWAFLEELDQVVIRCGGRLYLAKDARVSPASFRAMYPQYEDWLAIKRQVDPDNHFRSTLSERLEIQP